jgi:hypothetical protein
MKKILLFSLFLFVLNSLVYAQGETDGMAVYHQKNLELQKDAMWVLGSWAAANFAASGYMLTQTEGSAHYFNQMNVFWNTVNFGIAISGYFSAAGAELLTTPDDIIMAYNNFSKILLLNTGLDAAYIATGFFLKERAGNVSKHEKRFKGYGNSLILQGSFLLLFDIVLTVINETHLKAFLNSGKIDFALQPTMFSIAYSF